MNTLLLDTRGLRCPAPLLATKKMLQQLRDEQVLQVRITDPSSIIDIKVLVAVAGYELLTSIEQANYYEFWIRRSSVA